jgi:hypothetical protein
VAGSIAALMVATSSRPRDVWVVTVTVEDVVPGARFEAWLLGLTVGVEVSSLLVGIGIDLYASGARHLAVVQPQSSTRTPESRPIATRRRTPERGSSPPRCPGNGSNARRAALTRGARVVWPDG